MKITIENASITVTLNSVRYVHDFVTNIEINDPLENALTVSPQGGGVGIVYRTNTTSAISIGMTVRDLPVELQNLYKNAFKDQTRLDLMIANTNTGERYDFNNSIVQTNPINSTITEGDTSLDVALNLQAPPSSSDHESAA